MDLMSQVLSSALLLEQVAHEGKDGRKALVLRAFLERYLNGAGGLTPDWLFDEFNRFVKPDLVAMAAS
jgi:hypothetical protein